MKTDISPERDQNKEIEQLLRQALEQDNPPPKEAVNLIMLGTIVLPDDIMRDFVDRGWLPRQRCEIWSRVMGYFRPVSHFNPGKKAEFAERTRIDPRKIDPGD